MLNQGGSAEVKLLDGAKLILSTNEAHANEGTVDRIYVDYKNITSVMAIGQNVFIDDGLISLCVKEKVWIHVSCIVWWRRFLPIYQYCFSRTLQLCDFNLYQPVLYRVALFVAAAIGIVCQYFFCYYGFFICFFFALFCFGSFLIILLIRSIQSAFTSCMSLF